ncbi:MAG: gluconate 2-dehydrogenase subunit 3 family protein [Bacteroidota bacterium]
MKRRRVIQMILGGGAALVAGVTGYKYYSLYKSPDFDILDGNVGLIAELAETIIPETDTPGALSAGVGPMIVKLVRDCTPAPSQNNFLRGLIEVDSFSNSQFGQSFIACSSDQRMQVLKHMEEQGKPFPGIVGKVEKRLAGESFFALLKKYTIVGYATSEAGATKGFAYDYIPGKYVGNTPLEPGQKGWATQ